jgi:hypothetical protein
MGLVAVYGERKLVNTDLMSYAINNSPCIIVDCANVANIHKWFPFFPNADYDNIFVYEFELLYKFRDALIDLRETAIIHNVNNIIVTSMTHLFHYQNPSENHEIFVHIWELLKSLGEFFNVRVAIDKQQLRFAKAANAEVVMGHTVWSQRQNLENMILELERYGRSLRKEERLTWHNMLRTPLRHVGSISAANSLHAWSFLLLTIVLEQEKRIEVLEKYAGVSHRRVSYEDQHRLVVEN